MDTAHDFPQLASHNLVSYEGDEPYIFISYSHADTAAVAQLLKIIDKRKFRFWYDDTMEIGEDFRNELCVKIENCSAFLLFISDASMNSKYCGIEIITAYKNNKKIYPVYLRDDVVIPPALKMILENLQHVRGSAFSQISSEEGSRYIDKLIAGLPIETMRSLEIDDGILTRCRDGSHYISIPDDVKTIGDSAFKNCEKLEEVDIGESLVDLRKEAFRGCKNLKKLVLPENVRAVGESAFRDCIRLESVIVENNDIEIGERAFENCAILSEVKLQNGITEIYGGVFNSCKALVSIELPEKLTILGESSFADCASLKSIRVPDLVTKIDDMVFNGCIELEKIYLPNSLTKIGKSAFKDCRKLKKIFIPHSVFSIGAGPFRGCTNLETIEVDSKSKTFKSVDNILFNKNKSVLVCHPPMIDHTHYAVPDSVTVISDWAFSECVNLISVEIPDSVYEIGEGAFYMCTSLEELVIPDSVVKIDDTAFRGCSSLKRVVLPESVLDFGWGIFNGCPGVTVVCKNGSSAATYCDAKNIHHIEE